MGTRSWRHYLKRWAELVLSKQDSHRRRTMISDAEFTIPPRGQIVTDLTERTIRATEGESWQPPAPARRDPWRPRSDRW
jgi:hypothetical protein